MSAEHGNPTEPDRRAGCLGAVVAGVLLWAAVYGPDIPNRAKRVFFGSDRSEEVADDLGPKADTPMSDHTTPPPDRLDCRFVDVKPLDFEEKELAAARSLRHDTPQGALADCPGAAESGIGQPVSVDGQMAGYDECFAVAPDWTPLVESPTGRFVVACYAAQP